MELKAGYKATEVGVIPEEWRVCSLGELTTFVASGTSKNKALHGSYAVHGSTGVIGYSETADYSGDAILVARVGANAGRLNLVRGQYGVTDNTIIVRLGEHSSLPFVWYLLESKRLNRLVFGSGQPLITGTQLKSLPVCVPPLPEQRAIAEALGDMDALISGLDQLITKKRGIKQAAMEQLLTGKQRLPGFRGEWEVKSVRDIAEIRTGPFGTLLKAEEYSGTSGVPLISVGEIGAGAIRIHEHTPLVPDTVVRRLPQYVLRTGDIVFGRKGAVERSALVTERENGWFLGSDGISVRLSGECHPPYVAWQFQRHEVQAWLLQNASGTTMASLNQEVLNRVSIPFAPLPEQTAIAAVLSDMDAEITALEQRREKTRALKQGMMQELLTGRTRLV